MTIHDNGTGVDRTITSDSAGLYAAPSLAVGTYKVEVKAPGMAAMVANNLELPVAATVTQNFSLSVAAASQVVEVEANAALLETTKVSNSTVVNQATVQEVPLNGRHFVDLALLVPLTVTPPANGFLTAPLRGQGSFAFNSAGGREDSINYMINGINLSDPNQNQITFQPTIATVDEFQIDNSTFSAEYGRNSGSIVNIATRAGVNTWHAEGYEYLRNNDLDARNFSNPVGVPQAPDKHQPVRRRRQRRRSEGRGDFEFFLSYEGLKQRQAVPLSSTTLTAAQFAQAQTWSDSIVKNLVSLLPQANSGTNQFVGSTVAP